MKKEVLFGMVCMLVVLAGCRESKTPVEQARQQFIADLDSVIFLNGQLLKLAEAGQTYPQLQPVFLRLRSGYKKTEAFAEYFTPTTVRLVNGAPLDEIEDEENAVFEPGGLQVIEEILYGGEADRPELIRHIRKLLVNLKRIRMLWETMEITDSHVLDAWRLELLRIISLGISGFDTPASGTALPESRAALSAFRTNLAFYRNRLPAWEKLDSLARKADHFLKAGSFPDFDHAAFIVDCINPLARLLHESREKAGIPFTDDRRLLRGSAATFFDEGAFNPDALVADSRLGATPERVALGRMLFFDARLSGSSAVHCGSCHRPELAFTDGLKTSRALSGKSLARNAPTLLYAGLQQAQFYDLRAPSLEDQASDVIHNRDEMHGSVEAIVRWAASDPGYRGQFRKAYPGSNSVTPVQVKNALAAFVRSLSPFSSPFDRYMRGDKQALTGEQVKGFNLFMGKARCGTCHFVPLFNGTVPPDYQRTESEVLGVPATSDLESPRPDTDAGRGAHNRFPQWQKAFKTPTLRNISVTAPYMHNGAFATLQEVMAFYNEGGGAGLGMDVPNQTLASDKLHLTPVEIGRLTAFMESLKDRM